MFGSLLDLYMVPQLGRASLNPYVYKASGLPLFVPSPDHNVGLRQE